MIAFAVLLLSFATCTFLAPAIALPPQPGPPHLQADFRQKPSVLVLVRLGHSLLPQPSRPQWHLGLRRALPVSWHFDKAECEVACRGIAAHRTTTQRSRAPNQSSYRFTCMDSTQNEEVVVRINGRLIGKTKWLKNVQLNTGTKMSVKYALIAKIKTHARDFKACLLPGRY